MDLADLKDTARKYEYAKAERLAADRAAKDLKTLEDGFYAALVLHCNENGGAGVDMGPRAATGLGAGRGCADFFATGRRQC